MSNKMSGQRPTYDLGVENLPESWLQAEIDSPANDGVTPQQGEKRRMVMPKGHRTSPLTILLSSLLGACVAGVAWYLVARFDVYDGPWAAIPVGAAIAVIVRASCGAGDVPVRAMSSFLSYLAVLLAVVVFLTWGDVSAIYGEVGFGAYEDFLVENRLRRLDHVAAYLLGAGAAIQVSHLLRER